MINKVIELLEEKPGNIIEIGAGVGEITKELLRVTSKKNCKVIVIDPHELGWDEMPDSYGRPYPYHEFLENVSEYRDNLIHLRVSSLDKSVLGELKKFGPYRFAFVDGLQYKEAVLSDLELMHEVGVEVICVDDYTRLSEISQVPLAVEEFIKKYSNYKLEADSNQITNNSSDRCKAYLFK